MTDTQKGGIALIAGALSGATTMLTHPIAKDLLEPERFALMATVSAISHSIALVGSVLLVFGVLALYRCLDLNFRLPLVALITYFIGITCTTIAVILSGFVAPQVIGALLKAPQAQHDLWQVFQRYTYMLNQSFSLIYVFASWTAIVLWSVADYRSRRVSPQLGTYGIAAGILILGLVASGKLHLDVHGFMIVVFAQGIWYVGMGTALCRLPDAARR